MDNKKGKEKFSDIDNEEDEESLFLNDFLNSESVIEKTENIDNISNNSYDDSINIPIQDIEIEGNICNICYIEKEDLNNLECCKNTKKICNAKLVII